RDPVRPARGAPHPRRREPRQPGHRGGRGLYGRDRLPPGRNPGRGAHGHGPDRGADGAAVAGLARAGAVLRRRRRRTAGGLSRHRAGPAAAQVRALVSLRPAGRRPGPGRHPARQGRAGAASGPRRDPTVRRGAVRQGGR
ncbi:hypothetical protein GMDG_08987, partial [Pseudogymnoascus destructans 20631-21]